MDLTEATIGDAMVEWAPIDGFPEYLTSSTGLASFEWADTCESIASRGDEVYLRCNYPSISTLLFKTDPAIHHQPLAVVTVQIRVYSDLPAAAEREQPERIGTGGTHCTHRK